MALIGGVITGDIVNSNSLSDEAHQICLQQLEQTISILVDEFNAQGDVFRGDAFQVFVPDPKHTLRAAILLRLTLMTCVKGADARVSIGIGEYNQLESELRKTAKGEAFVLSGRELESIKEQRLALALSSVYQTTPTNLLLIQYLDFVITGLSEKQAEVLLPRLLYSHLTQDALAEKTKINRRSLASRLQRANSHLIMRTLDVFESSFLKENT